MGKETWWICEAEKAMTPPQSYPERLKEKLEDLHSVPCWNVNDELQAILSLIRESVGKDKRTFQSYDSERVLFEKAGWNSLRTELLQKWGLLK